MKTAVVATGYAPFVPPSHQTSAFHCPNCNAYSSQSWSPMYIHLGGGFEGVKPFSVALCNHCGKPSIWLDAVMVYPDSETSPLPNPDLPADVKADYEEARTISARSPRGAAALLRLAVQKLCKHLGESGDNLNADIRALVGKGLLPAVQQALDAVRVIGNNAVHPGQIDLQDEPGTAGALFLLVNLIGDQMITAPAQAAAVYNALPAGARDQVAKRDSPKV